MDLRQDIMELEGEIEQAGMTAAALIAPTGVHKVIPELGGGQAGMMTATSGAAKGGRGQGRGQVARKTKKQGALSAPANRVCKTRPITKLGKGATSMQARTLQGTTAAASTHTGMDDRAGMFAGDSSQGAAGAAALAPHGPEFQIHGFHKQFMAKVGPGQVEHVLGKSADGQWYLAMNRSNQDFVARKFFCRLHAKAHDQAQIHRDHQNAKAGNEF